MDQYAISFIGAGRVAGALCEVMQMKGIPIGRIVSESGRSSRDLALKCNAEGSAEPVFDESTGIIIVAVPDDRIPGVLRKIRCSDETIVAHTAGSVGLDVYPSTIRHKGVFYPLQTFSPGRKIDFTGLPLFIEGSDRYTEEALTELANKTGSTVHLSVTDQRRALHVAAVFSCNFVNHMLTGGKIAAVEAGFGFEVLGPLIRETFAKALEIGPENSQTGPAIRFDKGTIEKHIALLSFSPDLQKIYKEVTESIMNYYKQS